MLLSFVLYSPWFIYISRLFANTEFYNSNRFKARLATLNSRAGSSRGLFRLKCFSQHLTKLNTGKIQKIQKRHISIDYISIPTD